MADEYPPLSALEQAVLKRLRPEPAQDSVPPSLVRAIAQMRRFYPDDPATEADVQPMSILAQDSQNDMVRGTTDIKSRVRMNPLLLATAHGATINGTLAHELQHVRQNAALPSGAEGRAQYLQEFNQPHDLRPSEHDADLAKAAFTFSPGTQAAPQQFDADFAERLLRGVWGRK